MTTPQEVIDLLGTCIDIRLNYSISNETSVICQLDEVDSITHLQETYILIRLALIGIAALIAAMLVYRHDLRYWSGDYDYYYDLIAARKRLRIRLLLLLIVLCAGLFILIQRYPDQPSEKLALPRGNHAFNDTYREDLGGATFGNLISDPDTHSPTIEYIAKLHTTCTDPTIDDRLKEEIGTRLTNEFITNIATLNEDKVNRYIETIGKKP